MCLGCGSRFAPRPAAPARAAMPQTAMPQYAPDEMCMRCFGVLLPATQFDTRNMLGGIETSNGAALGGRAGRELTGGFIFLEMLAHLLFGAIQAKHFDKRLQQALREYPHSLCCPSCRSIVRR